MKNKPLILILLLSITLRVAGALYLGNQVVSLPGTADQVSYHTLALRFLDGHGLTFGEAWWPITAAGEPTAHWSYLYTAYLLIVYAIFGPSPVIARILQAIITGILHPYLIYRLVEMLFPTAASATKEPVSASPPLGRVTEAGSKSLLLPEAVINRIPLIAALITAGYGYFIYYSATLMTEPFFITAILGFLVLTLSLAKKLPYQRYRKIAVGLGIVISIAVLLRQLILLFIPFLFLWILVSGFRRRLFTPTIITLLVVVFVLAAAIAPLTYYNYSRFQRFVLINTNAGYALYWANHPYYGETFIPAAEMGETYQALIPDELRGLDEAALDQALLKLGIQFIVEDPVRYLHLCLSRIPLFFKFWPDGASGALSNFTRVFSFGIFLPFILYGAIRPLVRWEGKKRRMIFMLPSAPLSLIYLFCLVYTGIHILSWSQVRYRLPVDGVLLIFAALAIAELATKGEKLYTGITRNKGTGQGLQLDEAEANNVR